jgi:hypothetical protein
MRRQRAVVKAGVYWWQVSEWGQRLRKAFAGYILRWGTILTRRPRDLSECPSRRWLHPLTWPPHPR